MASRKCPQCGAPVAWEGNPDRPFCSERCRLVDLSGWLGERYAIPGEPAEEGAREDGAPAERTAGRGTEAAEEGPLPRRAGSRPRRAHS
jgi:hypothetical protein